MTPIPVDLSLVQKYNIPGPRYTSYPPAPRFSEEVRWDALVDELLENNRTNRDLSLYFHIPFCESLCWYCGCTNVITTQKEQGSRYLEYIEKEMQQMAAVLNPDREVVQLHFGGGTPTFLAPDELRHLGKIIRNKFKIGKGLEAGVEIDPRRLCQDHILALREIGFNRASLGVQDFNPVVQKAVHRIQPRAMTKEVIKWIRDAGFESLNIDLIYGLPHQTVESFERTLDQVLELEPDRLAIFSYAHVPWIKPAQKILETTALPTAETKLGILKLLVEKITSDGRYVYIGMDHFAKVYDELAVAQRNKTLQRNFQGYSTRSGADIYGFGLSAISQTPNVYWQNQKDLIEYYRLLNDGKSPNSKGYILTSDDKIRRETIMRLMCDLSLDYTSLSNRLGIDFKHYFARELESLSDMITDGLLHEYGDFLEVTESGRLFIRNIAMRFDAYLAQETGRRFSKTV